MKFDVRKYGPWALVTGASAGIGEQFARHLAAAGIHLILVARRLDRLQALKDELTASHDIEVELLAVDLSAPDAADRVAASVGDRDLGIIVSNAGDSLLKGEFTDDSRIPPPTPPPKHFSIAWASVSTANSSRQGWMCWFWLQAPPRRLR